MKQADWPHGDICANFNMVMGTQQGGTAMPASRLRNATELYPAIVHKLDLKVDPDVVRDELLSEIIKATLDSYDDDPNIRSSRELLGFTNRTQEDIDSIAADPDAKLEPAARIGKYENKGFRLYLARLHQSKG